MTIQSKRELYALQKIGAIVARTLHEMSEALAVGLTTQELDEIGRAVLARYGARPAPALCFGFPGATCISINEQVAHGVPGSRRICDGDLVNIDVSAELDGYFADTGASIPVGEAPATAKAVCRATQAALQAGIQVARHGNRLSDLQRVIGQTARRAGFSVIQNLSGHGIGRHLHEAPRHVPDNSRQDRRPFQRGMVLTLEPFLSTGATHAQEAGDGWTLVTRPGHWTAQFEHTIIVTDGKPIIVTQQ